MNAYTLLLSSLAMAASAIVHAQVTVQQATLNPETVAPAALFHALVVNSGLETQAHCEGRLHTRSGEEVLAFTSQPFVLRTGANMVAASSLSMRTYNYGRSAAAQQAQSHQRLIDGEYRFCLRVVAVGGEGDDELCETERVESMLFLDLVMPWNGDSIDETRPALTWLLTGTPAAVASANVRLTLVPKAAGKDAAQALASEVPVFQLQGVTQRTVAYPSGLPELSRGACYAWQAERVVDGRVVDRSDPWSFCVRQRLEPMADKYIRLDRLQPGTVYKAVDRRLFFRYDEPYAGAALRCTVIGPDGRRIEPEVNNEGAEGRPTGTASAGANLFELDLSPYGLKRGIHTLEVRDGKGRHYELQFESQF